MPMYTFDCCDCGAELEVVLPMSERDNARMHTDEEDTGCGGALVRRQLEKVNIVSPGYEPGALMSDGSIQKGHFGKEARKKSSGSYRP